MKFGLILIIVGSVVFLLFHEDIFGQEINFVDGNDLMEFMRDFEIISKEGVNSDNMKHVPGASFYPGYICGVFDATSHDYNLPKGQKINRDQITAIVEKYLKENPAQLHKSGSLLIEMALVDHLDFWNMD